MNIVFGTKRLTQTSVRNASVEKYKDLAVITVEGLKGANKSRRILMNKMASVLLNLEQGDVQELIFAPVQDTNQVLIANMATIDGDAGDMVSYKTSKNKVSYTESTEKGKAITSSHMCREIFEFLGKDDSVDIEFSLKSFETPSIEAFSLTAMPTESEVVENQTCTLNEVEVADAHYVENVVAAVTDTITDETVELNQGLRRATPATVTKEWV